MTDPPTAPPPLRLRMDRSVSEPFVDLDRLINSRDVCQFHNADETRRPLRQSTLRAWVHRGKLKVRGRDGRHNLYRLGDVLKLNATRRQSRGRHTADNRTTPV